MPIEINHPIEITPIPALRDNYIWAITCPSQPYCAIVDPGEAAPVFSFLSQNQLTLCAILVTHHHWDHTQGILEILEHFSEIEVFCPKLEPVPGCHHQVSSEKTIYLSGLGLTFQVLDIPGHTLGHVAYYGANSLFCGDTLFTGGCGRAFEGTPAQLYNSLHKLMQLPDDTQIYCGHEYTQKNLEFALTIEPHQSVLKARLEKTVALRKQRLPTVPSTLSVEKATNPFLRCHLPAVRNSVQMQVGVKLTDAVDVFTYLRKLKDSY